VRTFKLNFDNISYIVGLLFKLSVGCNCLVIGTLFVTPSLHLNQRDRLVCVVGGLVQTLNDVLVLQDDANLVVEEVVQGLHF